MIVKELIELLKDMPQEALVVMSKDSEGNRYSPFADMGTAIYVPETTWFGEVYSLDWTAEDADMSVEEWEKLKEKNGTAVVFWPTN